MTPGDAVDTLRAIAFELERAGGAGYRAEAFRAAARAVERLDPDRVRALAAAGSLTDLPGVGARTAEVVRQVLAGEPVTYLQRLPAAPAGPQDGPAAALHEALRGDLHAHTSASDGATSIQEMVLAALGLGHEYLAITDHSPRLTVAHGLSAPRLRAQLAEIAALNRVVGPFRVLTGIEVDVLDDGDLDQDDDLLDELDVVVASVHSALAMDAAAMTRRLITAVSDPRTDVLGHCTGRRLTGRPRPPSRFDAAAVFDACARHGVAVEINCRPDRLDPPDELLALAVEAGCVFTIDTDAHAPGELAWSTVGAVRAAEHGLTGDRVVDTWPADEVVARSHRR